MSPSGRIIHLPTRGLTGRGYPVAPGPAPEPEPDPGPDPTGGTRLPKNWHWGQLSPYNTAFATTATFSKTDDKAVRMRSLGAEGTVNHSSWSVRRGVATSSTPMAKITNIGVTPNVVYTDIPLDPNFQPPTAGTSTTTPDANSFIIFKNGYTAVDLFKLVSVDRTTNEWTCRRRVNHDLRDLGIHSGVRATGNSLGAGLVLAHELAAGKIPHALAISMNEKDLKLTPTSADGQLSTNGKAVWPGNQQDTQVPGALEYTGVIPMGTWFGLDFAVNLDTVTLASGAKLNTTQKAIARAAMDYGWVVTDRSKYCNIYLEPECTSAQAADARLVWREVIIPNAQRLTNQTSSTPGGGSPTATRRQPLAPAFDSSIPPL